MHKKDRSLFDLDEEIPIEVPVTARAYLRRARHSAVYIDVLVQDLIDVGELF